jgi:hypothetical protein
VLVKNTAQKYIRVFKTDESTEYSGNSFATPSQKHEYGPVKKRL